MPCWTVSTVEVAVEKMNPELLMAALTALKLDPFQTVGRITFGSGSTYDIVTGRMILKTTRDVTTLTKEIKRAYSAEVVKSQAKKYGWSIKQTAPYEYEVVKRS